MLSKAKVDVCSEIQNMSMLSKAKVDVCSEIQNTQHTN